MKRYATGKECNHTENREQIMGTSSSSTGSPSNVPMVPPWVPDIPDGPPADPPPDEELPVAPAPGDDFELAGEEEEGATPAQTPIPLDDKGHLVPNPLTRACSH